MPRHPSFLLKILITILDNCNTYSTSPYLPLSPSLSCSLLLSLFLLLCLFISFSLPLSLSLSLSVSLSLSPSLFFSLSMDHRQGIPCLCHGQAFALPVACTRKQKVRACTKHSSFAEVESPGRLYAFLIKSVNQSAGVIILYIKLSLCVCVCVCVCMCMFVCVSGIEIHTVGPILTKFGMGAQLYKGQVIGYVSAPARCGPPGSGGT